MRTTALSILDRDTRGRNETKHLIASARATTCSKRHVSSRAIQHSISTVVARSQRMSLCDTLRIAHPVVRKLSVRCAVPRQTRQPGPLDPPHAVRVNPVWRPGILQQEGCGGTQRTWVAGEVAPQQTGHRASDRSIGPQAPAGGGDVVSWSDPGRHAQAAEFASDSKLQRSVARGVLVCTACAAD